MRELDIFRRNELRRAQRAAAIHPGGNVGSNTNLMTAAEVRNAHAHGDIARLPETFSATNDTMQGAGGGWGFMVGMSSVDGPDPVI